MSNFKSNFEDNFNYLAIINDLSTGVDDWIIEQHQLHTPRSDRGGFYVAIGFKRGTDKRIVFNNLSFGFKLYDSDGEMLLFKKWPPTGQRYFAINTNGDNKLDESEILELCNIPIYPNKKYKIDLWTSESGILSECSHEFMFEPWNKPTDNEGNTFHSWVWDYDKNDWISPIGDPPDTTEFKTYHTKWNEDKKEWYVDKSEVTITEDMLNNVAGAEGVEPPDYDVE